MAVVVLTDQTAFQRGWNLRITGGVRERNEWVVGGGERAETERERREVTVLQYARIKNQKVEKQKEDEMWKMNDFIKSAFNDTKDPIFIPD